MTTSSHPTTSAVPDPGIFPVKRPLTKKKLFAYTFLSAVAGFLALFYIDRPSRVVQLSDEVSISSQLKVSDIGRFRLSEFKTIEYFVWRFFVVAAAVGVAYLAAGFIAIVLGWIQIIC